MRWVGYVARMGERTSVYRVWCGDPREREHFDDLGVGGKMILKWI